ncbi:hypothetical protein PHET_04597 [Paragonimus heterotremus]|uniref:Uncharacterized protein n=1 Tax=Paragonimus heterotremus TaxID=100268 RepID=A0A8J4WJ68_9TREM|nr:hypothetical protein PHET_04597 [Paragonimus heterotremus]
MKLFVNAVHTNLPDAGTEQIHYIRSKIKDVFHC